MSESKTSWKKIFFIFVIVLVILYISGSNTQPQNQNTEKNNVDRDYEIASQRWNEHMNVMNNDLRILRDYLDEYRGVKTASDISYLNDRVEPRLDIFDTHLIEARQFLNSYGYLFSNGAELKAEVDDKIVYSQTTRNTINTLTNDYNRQVEDYNQKIELLAKAFSLLI